MNKTLVILSVLLNALILPSWTLADALSETGVRVLGSPKGCFVFGQTALPREDQFMLDTCTGRLWKIAEDTTRGVIFLKSVVYDANHVEGVSPLPPALQQGSNK